MTRAIAVLVLAIGFPVAADDKAPKDAKGELERFTGTWQGVSLVRDGKEVPKETAAKMKLVVKGEKYTLTGDGEDVEGTHALDPTKNPKQIDAVRTSGPHKGEKMLGLYNLSEDAFLVCFAEPGKDRPKELKAQGGPGLRVLAFKREKK